MDFRFEQSGMTVRVDEQIVEWAEAYQSTMLDRHELISLAAALSSFQWNDGAFVVEIGAYLGTTTVFMARVLELLGQAVTILSIDPFERFEPNPFNPQGNYSAYMASIMANGVGHVCLPLASFSANAAHVVADNVGVLVIDGDHTYPAVSQDLKLYAPKVRSGGFIFVDDYGPAYPDVMQAVDEFLAANGDFRLHAKSYFMVAERMAQV